MKIDPETIQNFKKLSAHQVQITEKTFEVIDHLIAVIEQLSEDDETASVLIDIVNKLVENAKASTEQSGRILTTLKELSK